MKKYFLCKIALVGLLLVPFVSRAQITRPVFDPTHVYMITGRNGSVLTLSGTSPLATGSLVYGPVVNKGVARQQWFIQDAGGGLYKLINRCSGLSLYQNNNLYMSYWDTAPRQQPYAGQQRERWAIVRTNSDKNYIIADALTRAAIGVAGDNESPTANVNGELFHRIYRDLTIQQGYSHLNIVDVSTNQNVYTLTNLGSGKLLEVGNANETPGAGVQQWSQASTSVASQQWILAFQGNGYYTITNRNSGQALEIGGDDAQVRTPGARANQWPLWSGDKQQWRFDSDPATGAYTLTNKASGYVLEIGGGNTSADGAAANQWYGGGGNNQKWVLTYVGPN